MRNVASNFRESCLSRRKTISGLSRRIHGASDMYSSTSSVNRCGRSFRPRFSNRSSQRVTFILLLPRTSVSSRPVIRRSSPLLIGAEFPNYNDIVPREWEYTVSVKKSELLDALRRVGAVVFGGTDVITLSFKEGLLTIQGTAQDQGNARDELGYEGEAGGLSVSFFGTKLLDGISSVGTENAELHMNSAVHPVVIKDQGKEDFLYLVMPHKLME